MGRSRSGSRRDRSRNRRRRSGSRDRRDERDPLGIIVRSRDRRRGGGGGGGGLRVRDIVAGQVEDFIAANDIDNDVVAGHLRKLSPQDQEAVLAAGSVRNTRKPNAVVSSRIRKVQGGGGGGGIFEEVQPERPPRPPPPRSPQLQWEILSFI